MPKVKKETQINLTTPNEMGAGAKVFGKMAEAGVNIKSFCAFGTGNEANFILLTHDPVKAVKILKEAGYKVTTDEVVTVQVASQVGRAHNLSKHLTDAGINIEFCYATSTDAANQEATAVFKTNNNDKTVAVLSKLG